MSLLHIPYGEKVQEAEPNDSERESPQPRLRRVWHYFYDKLVPFAQTDHSQQSSSSEMEPFALTIRYRPQLEDLRRIITHSPIANAIHTLTIYRSPEEATQHGEIPGRTPLFTLHLFPALVHMNNLEELILIGNIGVNVDEELSRTLLNGRAKLPMKTIKIALKCLSAGMTDEGALCIVILGCPRLENLLFCRLDGMVHGAFSDSTRRKMRERHARWKFCEPFGIKVPQPPYLALSNAMTVRGIRTVILDTAEPIYSSVTDSLGHWLATATESPFTQIAALLPIDISGEPHGSSSTWKILQAAHSRLSSVRLTLFYSPYIHDTDPCTGERYPIFYTLANNQELTSVYIVVYIAPPFRPTTADALPFPAAVGLLRVLGSIQVEHASLQHIYITLAFTDSSGVLDQWPDELDEQLARLFREHSGLRITLGILCKEADAEPSENRTALHAMFTNMFPKTSSITQDGLAVIVSGIRVVGTEMETFRQVTEPVWYVKHADVLPAVVQYLQDNLHEDRTHRGEEHDEESDVEGSTEADSADEALEQVEGGSDVGEFGFKGEGKEGLNGAGPR